MTGPKQIVRQRDFTGGELVEHAKRRDDEAVVRSGARTLRNVRILSSGAVEQRPGRSALFAGEFRSDKVRMTPDYSAYLCFGDGTLTIRNSSGVPVARAWGYEWAEATVKQAVWAQFDNDVVITFPGQIPKIARWDAGTEWTFLDWAATVTSGGQKRVPFTRISPKSITLLPSARTGTIDLTFSSAVLVSGMIGTRIRFVNRQIEIASVTSGTVGTGTVKEPLPGSQVLSLSTNGLTSIFALGETVEGSVSGSKGYITSLATGAMTVQLTTTATSTGALSESVAGSVAFTTADSVVGPGGGFTPTSVAAIGNPVAVPIWDEEVFNSHQGYPRSVSVDQSRLIFTDFPAAPSGVAWSALLTPEDFYPGANPTDAIFETAPKKARVYHVMDGADEFAITDRGIYYIPISEANPLRPGSVAFRRVPGPSGSAVRPVTTAQGVVYVNNGLNRILGIVGTGQTAMPWLVRPVSDLHSQLFSGVTCLAVEEGDGDPPDELVYAVNAAGTVAVGRYQPGKEWVGWGLWSGEGDVGWISALGDAVIFSTEYTSGWIAEDTDPDRYLDASVVYNAIPSPLAVGAQAEIFIPIDQGTAIGDLTSGGGLAVAFDGNGSHLAAACATKAAATTGAVGKTFNQAIRISSARAIPSSDAGFSSVTPVTVSLRAKAGAAPSNYASEGTQLATTGSIADTTTQQVLTSGDTTTEWDHAWVLVTQASGTISVAEVQLYSVGVTHDTGELWFLTGETLRVMDGLRNIGNRVIDGDGEVTLQEGDAFTDETFGHGFDVNIEPFIAHMQGGQSVKQTINKRQISGGAVTAQNSTGLRVEKWNPNDEDWDVVKTRSPYDTGDDEGDAPPLREEVIEFGALGAEHDPRVRIVKDWPGPVRVLEIDFEIGA